MGTPAPYARRNISCEARRAVRWAAPGHAVAIGARLLWVHGCRKEAAVKVAAGERSSGVARVSTRAAAPYARQTMWLQRVCAVYWCGASSRDTGRSAAGVREHGRPSASMQSALATTHLLQPSARKTLRALNCGRICAPCVIRGVSAAKRAPPWQDLRAMHSRKAVCGAFRIHGAHILPKPARFGYMAAICCQGGALFPSEGAFGMHEAK